MLDPCPIRLLTQCSAAPLIGASGDEHGQNTSTSEAKLTAIYGPHDTVVATIKEIDHISEHYRMFIDLSPFVVVSHVWPRWA